MSVDQRLQRYEGLLRLLRNLSGPEFGASPACRDADPELFFPVSESDTAQIDRAKNVCRACPVQGSCLQVAMHSPVEGIWGGTTESERRELRVLRSRTDQHTNTPGVAA